MIRALCLVPIGVAVALPVLVLPSPGSGMLGALAGVLCGVGVLGGWRRLVLAGGVLVLVHYALALWITAPPASIAMAVALGVGLVLVADVAEFLHRFPGAAVAPSALWRQCRHWIVVPVLGALAAFAVGAGSGLVGLAGPPILYPILAALAALGVTVGVLGAVGARRE
jgi:hypothetical protein